MRVIACLAEGLGIRGTARVFEIDPNTVLSWLVQAAEQFKTFSTYFLHELHLNQIQLDELYAVLSAVRDGDINAAEAIERLSRSPHWVWTAIDPESKLLLSVQVGERTLAMAQAVLHQLTQLLAPGCVPLFLRDGYPHYLTVIVAHFGHWVHLLRPQARGPALQPRWMPLPELLYVTDICWQDDGLRRGRADHCREPSERGRAPIGPAHGADSGSEQERFEAKLGVCEIAAGLCTSPAEVTHGCVFHLGDRDRGEIA